MNLFKILKKSFRWLFCFGVTRNLISGNRSIAMSGLAAAFLLMFFQILDPDFFKNIDNLTYDFLIEHCPNNRHSESIVVVNIDEKSLIKYGQWPWPRDRVALLFDNIASMQASAIGVDMIFAESDRTSADSVLKKLSSSFKAVLEQKQYAEFLKDKDLVLAESLADKPFVLGLQFHFEDGAEKTRNCLLHPVDISVFDKGGEEDFTAIPEGKGALCSLPVFSEKVAMSGFNNFAPDSDGKLRRVPLVIKYDKKYYASLALATALEFKGMNTVLIVKKNGVLNSVKAAGVTIPVDNSGQMLVKFRNDEKRYKHLSAADIMEGRINPDLLKGKIVFVGTSAIGLKELRATPFNPKFPGAEVHATVVDNIVNADFISSPEWTLVFITLLICVFQTFVFMYGNPVISVLFLISSMTGLWLAAQQLFYIRGLFIGVSFSMISVGVHFVVMAAVRRKVEIVRDRNALKASEKRFRTLFRKAPVAMAQIAVSGEVLDLNDSMIESLGYGIVDVSTVEKAWELFFRDPQSSDRVRRKWLYNVKGFSGQNVSEKNNEYLVHCKDGRIKSMLIEMKRLENSVLVNFFDMTEIKKAEEERERLKQQLFQSKKLEAIGLLAGGVAHDFNNALGVIIGYAELATLDIPPHEPHRRFFDVILDTAKRSANLTRQLLAFARKQSIAPEVFNLNESIEDSLGMVDQLTGKNIELVWIPYSESCFVKMDPSQFDQIIINLCVNARDAIEKDGCITLKTGIFEVDEKFSESHEEFRTGTYVFLSVSDDGQGMDRETLSHIFEPFFTTKDVGKGTGMGLATVYGIIKQNGGTVTVDSDYGRGSVFTIYLPVADVPEKKKETGHMERTFSGNGEHVLLVEDEPVFREMALMMLKRLGYNVKSAGSPTEALKLIKDGLFKPDIFVTDVVMPEMNGWVLAENVKKIIPSVKYLFMSGYMPDKLALKEVHMRKENYIQKPFSYNEIALKVQSMFNT